MSIGMPELLSLSYVASRIKGIVRIAGAIIGEYGELFIPISPINSCQN